MAKEKKLTLKHFYGDDLKKVGKNAGNLFPMYMQVTYNRKSTKLKSFSVETVLHLHQMENKMRINDRFDRSSPDLFEYDYKDHENKIIQNMIDVRPQMFIDEDERILNKLKQLYERNMVTDFDISFFTSDRCDSLKLPIDLYINNTLKNELINFFMDKRYGHIVNIVRMLKDSHCDPYLISLSDLNLKLYHEILSKPKFYFLVYFPRILIKQRGYFKDKKFYHLFDVYDKTRIESVFSIAEEMLDESQLPFFKEIALEYAAGEIQGIFNRP